nr:immunoglobulin heavy chain junction region [Macaca mulatta]MOY21984.1 immunoglobulin heavy chain junction region [Macaca mulatta]MOY22183.1 immunoglobulin heavy chain junction region [Macaca mulatta]MOY27534.1 immunoglobulin heavy chain junction region [Macaca mulatta]MOY29966.1 immunoglobulin heavy chain junction region [Macaca mulatta]
CASAGESQFDYW